MLNDEEYRAVRRLIWEWWDFDSIHALLMTAKRMHQRYVESLES